MPIRTVGKVVILHLNGAIAIDVPDANLDRLIVNRPLGILVIPEQPFSHTPLDDPELGREVGILRPRIAAPCVQECSVEK
jgi:hypothetical protein